MNTNVHLIYVSIPIDLYRSKFRNELVKSMREFCCSAYGARGWDWEFDGYNDSFAFNREEDATMFRLRWGEFITTPVTFGPIQ